MSGRPNQKVFEYTTEGVYIRSYESISEYREERYPDDIGKRPIFVHKIEGLDFHFTKDDTILLKERPGREKIVFIYKIWTSKLCNFNKSKEDGKPIQMFNLKNELIAEFASTKVAKVLLSPDISYNTLMGHLRKRKGEKTFALVSDYYFKYKEIKERL